MVTAVDHAIRGYYFNNGITLFTNLLFPFTASGFFSIAVCDLMPELLKQSDPKKAVIPLLFFIFGILFMLLLTLKHSH